MKKFQFFLIMGLAIFASHSRADSAGGELDGSESAPPSLIVQEDTQGNLITFQSSENALITDDVAAQSAIAVNVNSMNQISHIAVVGELDQTSSSEQWFRWYQQGFAVGWGGAYVGYNFGWNYGFNISGFVYHYASYYGCRLGGYIYHFFHRH
jgi:hypothetical protein